LNKRILKDRIFHENYENSGKNLDKIDSCKPILKESSINEIDTTNPSTPENKMYG